MPSGACVTESEDGIGLPDKALEVLVHLARRQGEICSREELLGAVWGADRHVYDRVLDTAIRDVRRAFGDSAKEPRYIRTYAKRGYCLVAEVEWMEPGDVDGSARSEKEESSDEDGASTDPPVLSSGFERRLRVYRAFLLLTAVVLAGVAVYVLWMPAVLRVRVGHFEVDGLALSRLDEDFGRRLQAADGCSGSRLYRYKEMFLFAGSTLEGELRAYGDRLFLTARIDGLSSGTVELPEVQGPRALGHGPLLNKAVSQVRHVIDQEICGVDRGLAAEGDRVCHCVEAAHRFRNGRQMDEAKRYYRHVLAADPLDIPAIDGLANVHQTLGEDEEALELLQTLLQVAAPRPGSREDLELRRRLAQVQEDFKTEETLLAQLVEAVDARLDDRLAWAWFQQTHRAACERSLELYRDLKGSAAARPSVWAYLGEAELACGDREEALRAFEAYTEVEPYSPDAWDALAWALGQMGFHERAGEALRHVLQLDATYAPALLQRVEWYRRAGHFDEARRELLLYEEQVEGRRGQAEVDLQQARSAWRTGRFDDAERYVEASLAVETTRVEALWLAGRLAVARGDLDAARGRAELIHGLREARGTSWQMETFHHLTAEIASAEGRFDDAVESLQRALSLSPPDGSFYRTALARAYARAGRDADAASELEAVLADGGGFPEAQCLRGRLLHRAGDGKAAAEAFARMDSLWLKDTPDLRARQCRVAMVESGGETVRLSAR